jgi:Flp pilus assembly protein TadB
MSVFPPQSTNLDDAPRSPDVDSLDQEQRTDEHEKEGQGGHSRWMMIACCIPMLAIAVAVAGAGGGAGFLVIAVMCTLMMAAMMGGMSHGGGGGNKR